MQIIKSHNIKQDSWTNCRSSSSSSSSSSNSSVVVVVVVVYILKCTQKGLVFD